MGNINNLTSYKRHLSLKKKYYTKYKALKLLNLSEIKLEISYSDFHSIDDENDNVNLILEEEGINKIRAAYLDDKQAYEVLLFMRPPDA